MRGIDSKSSLWGSKRSLYWGLITRRPTQSILAFTGLHAWLNIEWNSPFFGQGFYRFFFKFIITFFQRIQYCVAGRPGCSFSGCWPWVSLWGAEPHVCSVRRHTEAQLWYDEIQLACSSLCIIIKTLITNNNYGYLCTVYCYAGILTISSPTVEYPTSIIPTAIMGNYGNNLQYVHLR